MNASLGKKLRGHAQGDMFGSILIAFSKEF
jgi:hypothetical protein